MFQADILEEKASSSLVWSSLGMLSALLGNRMTVYIVC
jgi:hypothetical protein